MDRFSGLSSDVQLSIIASIAEQAEWVYWALRRAIPSFRRSITAAAHVDYLIHFGYVVRISQTSIRWTVRDRLHRVDGPAMVTVESIVRMDTRTHSVPIFMRDSGTEIWYQHGKRHRTNGPAISGEDLYWYRRNQLHRTDGPAIIRKNRNEWYRYNRRHRTDGPAVERSDGDNEWWLHGEFQRGMHGSEPCNHESNCMLMY